MTIKMSIGKLILPYPAPVFFDQQAAINGFSVLGITSADLIALHSLPHHHRDPFDRILVCQAMVNGLSIASIDDNLDPYGVARVW